MVPAEVRTETPINYIEITSVLDQHPSMREKLRGFLERWRGSEVFQQAAFDASADVLGPLKAAGKMVENGEIMEEAMEVMEIVCENVERVNLRFEQLKQLVQLPEENALRVITREYFLEGMAEGFGFAQQPEIQKFLNGEVKKVVPRVNRIPNLIRGLILERTPDGRAAIYYCREDSVQGRPFKMWPPVILPEDSEIGLALYFLTSSWGLIKQERKSL